MTIKEFLKKYNDVKKEMGLEGFYIPHICDKLYPWVEHTRPTKKAVKIEIKRFYDIYKNLPINKRLRIKGDLF